MWYVCEWNIVGWRAEIQIPGRNNVYNQLKVPNYFDILHIIGFICPNGLECWFLHAEVMRTLSVYGIVIVIMLGSFLSGWCSMFDGKSMLPYNLKSHNTFRYNTLWVYQITCWIRNKVYKWWTVLSGSILSLAWLWLVKWLGTLFDLVMIGKQCIQ